MSDLIKALKIFIKYKNSKWPTNCTNDVLTIMDIDPTEVSDEDKSELEILGFLIDEDENCFVSYKFGSA